MGRRSQGRLGGFVFSARMAWKKGAWRKGSCLSQFAIAVRPQHATGGLIVWSYINQVRCHCAQWALSHLVSRGRKHQCNQYKLDPDIRRWDLFESTLNEAVEGRERVCLIVEIRLECMKQVPACAVWDRVERRHLTNILVCERYLVRSLVGDTVLSRRCGSCNRIGIVHLCRVLLVEA